jgi:hypothetical protein
MPSAVQDNITVVINHTNLSLRTLTNQLHDIEAKYGAKTKVQITAQSGTNFTLTVYKNYVN